MKQPKILLIQIKQLGDVLMCTPAIRAIKAAYPHCDLHLLTQAPADQLFQNEPLVDQIWNFPKGSPIKATTQLAYALYQAHFDWVIDFYNKPLSATLSWLSGAKVRVGYNRKGRSWAYTAKVNPKPKTRYSANERLELLAPLKIFADNLQITFPIRDIDRTSAQRILDQLKYDPNKPLITLSPVSRRVYRIWPPEKFAQAANQIIHHTKGQLLLLWGPGEKHFIEPVRAKLTISDLGDYEPPSLAEMAAIFEKTSFHFGNDNGPMHIAITAKCPSLTLVGQSIMGNWVPPKSQLHHGIEHDPGCKQHCIWPNCELQCLDIEVQHVVDQALKIIRSQSTQT